MNFFFNILLFFYQVIVLFFSPWLFIAFLCHIRGRKRLIERFGIWNSRGFREPANKIIWFHGASVGEVLGLVPLIKQCKRDLPQYKILLTAVSPTGLEAAKDFPDYKFLLPFDCIVWLKFACHKLNISAFVFGETEIWPALFSLLAARKVPMLLVNGRFSDSSARFWQKMPFLIEQCLKKIKIVFAINEKYQARFTAFGSTEVVLNGNSKYDSTPSITSENDACNFKNDFFKEDKPTFVIGSLRIGEEKIIFPALKAFKDLSAISVVIAPRHQEKMAYFADKLQEYGIKFTRRTALLQNKYPTEESVVLLDTLGELEKVYSFADLAFIGGTLVEGIGGHNPLEAAAYAVPIILGKYCENIDNIVEELKLVSGVFLIDTENDVLVLLEKLLIEPEQFIIVGKAAQTVWQKNRGACQNILSYLYKELGEK